jgi:hypothetical protein
VRVGDSVVGRDAGLFSDLFVDGAVRTASAAQRTDALLGEAKCSAVVAVAASHRSGVVDVGADIGSMVRVGAVRGVAEAVRDVDGVLDGMDRVQCCNGCMEVLPLVMAATHSLAEHTAVDMAVLEVEGVDAAAKDTLTVASVPGSEQGLALRSY